MWRIDVFYHLVANFDHYTTTDFNHTYQLVCSRYFRQQISYKVPKIAVSYIEYGLLFYILFITLSRATCNYYPYNIWCSAAGIASPRLVDIH